jgi:uncharacterized FAD-dependent dehydrogenase
MASRCYECVVVGAGPAGLAYASSLQEKNSVLVLDLGKPVKERHRDNPEECVTGAGGAGLFSDGKFSFYPSGTHIWEQEEAPLREAYRRLEKDLSPFSTIPPFPRIERSDPCQSVSAQWSLKPYESIYLSLDRRLQLIQHLADQCFQILYETEFLEYKKLGDGSYDIQILHLQSGAKESILAKRIVLAGGRFLPLFLPCARQFRRYEFGFRVEGPSHLFEKPALIDPKYIVDLGLKGVECRTFCWCTNGEVVPTRFKHIETYSGRADGSATNKSNFGFNFRIKDPDLCSRDDFQAMLALKPYRVKFKDLGKALQLFPAPIQTIIKLGAEALRTQFPKLDDNEVELQGPTLEGVGDYPDLSDSFHLKQDPGISVIGDCSGLYRGIVASMLSGYLLAHQHSQKKEVL